MKLFKKLAAVALAAVLALTVLAGCGAAVTTKDYYLNAIDDFAYARMPSTKVIHDDAIDAAAEKILSKVSEKYTEETNPYELLLDEELWAEAGVETGYYISIAPAVQYKSALGNSMMLDQMVGNLLYNRDDKVGDVTFTESEVQFGIAVGKVGRWDVVLMLKR